MLSTAEKKFERMTTKFTKLMMSIMSALEKKIAEKQLDLDKLKTFLIFKDPDHQKQFSDAQSVDDLLKVIRNNCAFTSPYLLEALSDMFELLEEEKKVQQYWNDLDKYYEEVLAEDFAKEGLVHYDKDANIEVSMLCSLIGIIAMV